MNYRRVRIITVLIALVVGAILLLIFYPNISYSLGFILGSLAGWGAFELFYYITMHSSMRFLRKSLSISRILRMLIYAGALIVSLTISSLFNFVTLFFGILVIKLAIVLSHSYRKGMGSNEH